MRFTFANVSCGPVSLTARPQSVRARSRAEMAAFDELPVEARQRIANSAFGVQLADIADTVKRRGASDIVKARLKERGVFPCDVGTEGVILETVAVLEEHERKRIADELAA